jgi:hypothetical protein
MNRDEFEGLTRRFGDDAGRWPAPYRQEARRFLGLEDPDAGAGDDDLDRLVLASAHVPVDESALARRVLARADARRRIWFGPARIEDRFVVPLAVACLVLAFIGAGALGYAAGEPDFRGTEDALLALAAGEAPVGLSEADNPGEIGEGWL